MTREEAIQILSTRDAHGVLCGYTSGVTEALDMAIEALSQPIVAKHFDIQSGYIYCSPQIAENVKVVVRCKDCKWWGGNKNTEHNNHICNRALNQDVDYWTRADDFCSHGERREP